MGYVHNTHFSQYLPPNLFHFVGGTWADAAGQVAGTTVRKRTAADAVATVNIPVLIPSNAVAQQGAFLKSIEIDFEILTAALDALAATVNKVTRGADGAIAVVAAQDFTYDNGHNDAGERVDVDQHRLTLTLDSPIWIDSDEYVLVALSIDGSAAGVLDLLGAVANFTLRA